MNKYSITRVMSLCVLVSLTALAGCKDDQVAFDKYRDMDAEERVTYVDNIKDLIKDKKAFDALKDKALKQELPVYATFDGPDGQEVKVTKIWDKGMKKLSLYEGHQTSTFGHNQNMIIAVLTEDDDPVMRLQENRQTGIFGPTVFLTDSTSIPTWLRSASLEVLGWGGFALNGAVAAEIGKCDSNNCATRIDVNTNNGSSSQSGSESTASGSANVGLNTCPSGNCAVIPTE